MISPALGRCRSGDSFLKGGGTFVARLKFRKIVIEKSHNDGRNVNIGLDGLVGQNAAAVDVNLISDCDIVTENGHILQSRPSTYSAVPANNGRLDPGMVLDLGGTQQDAALQADAITNNNIGANGDIGSYPAVLANLGRGVDKNVAAMNIRLGGGCEIFAALLGERRKVQASSAEEILGLADIHPESVQVKGVQLIIGNHRRKCLLLDRCGTQFDALENRGIEDVQTSIDTVADEFDRLLNEALNTRGVVRLVNDNTILRRLLNLSHNNGTLVTVALVEGQEVPEGIITNDIGVENKKGGIVLAQNLLSELERAASVERL